MNLIALPVSKVLTFDLPLTPLVRTWRLSAITSREKCAPAISIHRRDSPAEPNQMEPSSGN